MRTLLFLVLLFGSSTLLSKNDEFVNVLNAIKSRSIKATATSKGGHTGRCIKAQFQNLGNTRLVIDIPAGVVLHPTDTSMQSILLVKGMKIELEKGKTSNVELYGFCCNSNKRSPQEGITFSFADHSNSKLRELAHFMSKGKYPTYAMQDAVWAISDPGQHDLSQIYHDNPDSVKALRAEVARLTGQKDNWYSLKTEHQVDDRGYIISTPVVVTGNITVSLDKPGKLLQEVCKENGEVVWTPKNTLEAPRSGNMTYTFKLKVTGWEKGKYFVRVSVPGKVLLKQDFTI
jgi:hypothetical protein